jgi:hypothetical protein
MGTATGQKACYLVEWYREEAWQRESFTSAFAQLSQGAELLTEDGLSATVLMTLAVPTDDAIFCVFAAPSAEGVTNACCRAGLPPQRVTAAVAMCRTHGTPRAV